MRHPNPTKPHIFRFDGSPRGWTYRPASYLGKHHMREAALNAAAYRFCAIHNGRFG